MKISNTVIALAVASWVITSCSDDNQEARTPLARVEIESPELNIHESMRLRFTGVADQVVIYTGDQDHQYALRDSSNTGFAAAKNLFTYAYSSPGTFHVVCVATTYDSNMGRHLQTDTVGFDVRVTDNITDIDAISATVTPNVYYAEQITDEDWVMRLPAKQLYNNREMTVNAARQRLNFTLGSDSATVYIDGEPWVAKNYYALNDEHELRVVSGSGIERGYQLFGLVYPEFTSITIGGVSPTLERSAFYQDLLVYTGSHEGALEFTLERGVVLLADGREVASGAAFNPAATYSLVRTHDKRSDVKATTRVMFQR